MWNLPKRDVVKKQFKLKISPAEEELKDKLLRAGIRVVPQFQIGKYFVDFALPEYLLAIEYDGEIHQQLNEYDTERQKEIEKLGWKFLRMKNVGNPTRYQIEFDNKVVYSGMTQEDMFQRAIKIIKDYIQYKIQHSKEFIVKFSAEEIDENGNEILLSKWFSVGDILKDRYR